MRATAVKSAFRAARIHISAAPGHYGKEMYEALFPVASVQRKAFYNFGAGKWRHPYWTNVDYHSDFYNNKSELIDIHWDIASLKPVPVETGTAELVYSSHTIEHLLDRHVDHMLAEAARILKPGGLCRITTPNIRLYYEAYKRGDIYFNYHYRYDQPFSSKRELAPWLVHEMASQLRRSDRAGEVESILASMPMEEAFTRLSGMIDFDIQRRETGDHVSWWTNEKLSAALKRAGFSDTIISVAGGSVSPVMRDRFHFDTVIPTCSLFVEGVR